MKVIINTPTSVSLEKADSVYSIRQEPLNLILSKIIPSSCDELVIGDCLDYIYNRNLPAFTSLVRLNGTIVLCGNDIYEISRLITLGTKIDIAKTFYSARQSISSLEEVVTELEKLGFHVTKKHIEDTQYSITAVRKS